VSQPGVGGGILSPPQTFPDAVISVERASKTFVQKKSTLSWRKPAEIRAVRGVTMDIRQHEIVALVGESGSGKSTLARMIMGVEVPTGGRITFLGEDIETMSAARRRKFRGEVQLVFQDPFASLNPRMKVMDLIGEAWDIHGHGFRGLSKDSGVAALVEAVGLNLNQLDRYPSSFSGGQRQRIAVARALAIDPTVLVCDEPVSALDVSVQAQILNLLMDLQEHFSLSMLLISHDLSVVRQVATRVYVMSEGEIVEFGTVDSIFEEPQHEYTQALLKASPGQRLP
jgi:ABC-type glutathione transport system ATPase component